MERFKSFAITFLTAMAVFQAWTKSLRLRESSFCILVDYKIASGFWSMYGLRFSLIGCNDSSLGFSIL